ncbi:hypothetical protein DER45DRAFT_577719 [Fusarium avenaceum]|nr:hypothetical protein DER45DRAFT_577719 [Fusarium avenaceum]
MSNPENYTVGWICAVTTEFVAARALLDEKHDKLESNAYQDNSIYALGRIGKHDVVMAALPKSEYGMTSAATVARDMLRSFPNVRFGLMVGIGGGAPSVKHDIRLGDIVVSTRGHGEGGVFQYDYGKAIQDHSFTTTGSLNQPPQLLLSAVGALEAEYELEGQQLSRHVDEALDQRPHLRQKYSRPPPDSDKLYRPDVVHPDSPDICAKVCGDNPADLVDRIKRSEQNSEPTIHYGLVASANALMKDALIRDSLADDKNVLCFEMEAAGLMNHFPCIVIRGICDYADSHKNKEWQGFAAIIAAAYAKDLLYQIPPSEVEAEIPIRKSLHSIEILGNTTKELVTSMTLNHRVAAIERWLSPPDYSANANLARKQCHPGSGTWLLNSPAFHEWKSGLRQHLWLYGIAGCGKSVLNTTILDHLQSNSDHNTLAFYFDFNDPEKQKVDNLLRSLAAQIYRTGNEAARRLDNLFASHNNGQKQPDTNALSVYINMVVEITGRVSILIDALDECTTRMELIQWLKHSISNKAQFIVTSRPETEFKSEIPRLFNNQNCILLDKKAINADICSYVEAALKQRPDFMNRNLSPSILGMVRDRIGNGADGMFRWAACQLDSLAQCLSPRDIRIALETLPRDLNETYRRMLADIPPRHRPSATRLLQFLVHTKRPLKVTEAIEVIATQVEQEPRGFSVEGRLCQECDILRYCPSLVVVAKVRRFDTFDEELHLAHFSVKEYLLKQARFNLESASIIIAETCLTYLKDIESDYSTLKADFPMAQYAAEYWTEYAISAGDTGEIARSTISFLNNDITFQRWTRLYQADKPRDKNPGPPRSTKLYYACICNLVAAARTLVLEGTDVNAQGGVYGNALQAASVNGHLDIVKLLLDNGADTRAQGGRYGNAFQAALFNGHTDVVLLLTNGAYDIEVQASSNGNALQTASLDGHLEVVQRLLEEGADVETHDGYHGNALQAASSNGHREVVQLLLDKGADVNAQGGIHGNALQAASCNDHREVVQLLLDKGADVNAQGGIHGNALQSASLNGHLDVVQLLLSSGADAKIQGSAFGSALQAASANGHREIVRLLLSYGADVNIMEKHTTATGVMQESSLKDGQATNIKKRPGSMSINGRAKLPRS